MADNNPFNREDLEVIASMVKEEPRYTLFFGKSGQFQMKFWDTIPVGSTYPLIIGVDTASGVHRDASAITVIDSETTKVIATFRNNFITMPELADLIYQFVTGYAKNAICIIENNGATKVSLDRVICQCFSVNCYDSLVKSQTYYNAA